MITLNEKILLNVISVSTHVRYGCQYKHGSVRIQSRDNLFQMSAHKQTPFPYRSTHLPPQAPQGQTSFARPT